MATISVVKLKVRRGADSERKQITLDTGELGYVQDAESRRLFVGDGSTRGGNPVGAKLYVGSLSSPTALKTAQVGDLIYNKDDNKLYALSGKNTEDFPAYDNPEAYFFIGSRPDNSTIEYNPVGKLRVKDDSITKEKINSNLFNFAQGITRNVSGVISINYDGDTIKAHDTSPFQLYVNAAALNIGDLQTLNQSINVSTIKFTEINNTNIGLLPGQIWKDSGGYLRVV